MTNTAQLNGNGLPKGRAVPELAAFTFANGATATLRPVSQFTKAHVEMAMRKKYPPPDPPLNEVDYGDGQKKREPNYSDPDYEQAIKQYQATLSIKMLDGIIDLGVDIEIDQVALGRVQESMVRIGIPLEEISDKVAYVKHCCMFSLEREMPDLMTAMEKLIGPREEDVADHIATFPDIVSG